MSTPNPLIAAVIDALTDDDLADLAQRLQPHLLNQRRAAEEDDLMTTEEAAGYLRCDRQRIYDLRHSGALTPQRDGTRLLFRRRDVDRYLAERAGR